MIAVYLVWGLGCRFHEWARLTLDGLVREPGGAIIAARLRVIGSFFRDRPLPKESAASLEEWFAVFAQGSYDYA